MSSIARLVVIAALSVVQFGGEAQECPLQGMPGWSEQIRDLLPSCNAQIPSPDGGFVALINEAGGVSVRRQDGRHIGKMGKAIEPPAMLSWAPDSSRFFINDGQGSGMSSVLRVLAGLPDELVEDDRFQRATARAFRRHAGCDRSALDPDVWGFGWSRDSAQLFVLVTPTVHRRCGSSPAIFAVNVSDASIREQLSVDDAVRRFPDLLPPSLRK
jgi:hypothetical protein